MDSTLLTTSSRLAFDPNSYYIAVIARSEKPEVRVALKSCEDVVDREITNLSLVKIWSFLNAFGIRNIHESEFKVRLCG